jgi:catechol 2,3-dioxygenase-like lactoylglutathione lyase family enzyme
MPVVPPEDQLVVELFVRDFEASLAFYTAFGFEVERREEDFAVLRWEGCALFLDASPGQGTRPSQPAGNVRVMVPDVDAYWRKAREMGAPVLGGGIGDRPYGLRDFTVLDPDGFGVRFASPLSGRA